MPGFELQIHRMSRPAGEMRGLLAKHIKGLAPYRTNVSRNQTQQPVDDGEARIADLTFQLRDPRYINRLPSAALMPAIVRSPSLSFS